MYSLNEEKVSYAIQVFLLFLNVAQENKSISHEEMEKFREEAITISTHLQLKEVDISEALSKFNALVERMNSFLKTPYPTLLLDSPENFVKGEILAFEYYLHQELKANYLTVQQEKPLFNDALQLWEKIGTTLSLQQGLSEFSQIVKKHNSYLPDKSKYPELPHELPAP